MNKVKRKTSAYWYVLTLLFWFLAFGFVGYSVVNIYQVISQFGGSITQHVVPGSFIYTVEEPGWQRIYYEYRSEVNGVRYSTPVNQMPSSTITVTDKQTNQPVTLFDPMEETYSFISRAGYLVYQFEATKPGDYSVNVVKNNPANATSPFVIAIGDWSVWNFVGHMTTAMALIVLSVFLFVIGLVVALVVFIKRKSFAELHAS